MSFLSQTYIANETNAREQMRAQLRQEQQRLHAAFAERSERALAAQAAKTDDSVQRAEEHLTARVDDLQSQTDSNLAEERRAREAQQALYEQQLSQMMQHLELQARGSYGGVRTQARASVARLHFGRRSAHGLRRVRS